MCSVGLTVTVSKVTCSALQSFDVFFPAFVIWLIFKTLFLKLAAHRRKFWLNIVLTEKILCLLSSSLTITWWSFPCICNLTHNFIKKFNIVLTEKILCLLSSSLTIIWWSEKKSCFEVDVKKPFSLKKKVFWKSMFRLRNIKTDRKVEKEIMVRCKMTGKKGWS